MKHPEGNFDMILQPYGDLIFQFSEYFAGTKLKLNDKPKREIACGNKLQRNIFVKELPEII